MAKLYSEDEHIKSSIELILLKDQLESKEAISWVPYKLNLESADKQLVFERENNNQGAGDYVLALEPVNEVDNLIKGIKNLLESKTSNLFSFEPLEPSFEFILERAHKGYSVTFWMDAGNVISDHYSWDGFGVRFFTSETKLNSFIQELIKDKEDLRLKNSA